jgi:hypothetical protein
METLPNRLSQPTGDISSMRSWVAARVSGRGVIAVGTRWAGTVWDTVETPMCGCGVVAPEIDCASTAWGCGWGRGWEYGMTATSPDGLGVNGLVPTKLGANGLASAAAGESAKDDPAKSSGTANRHRVRKRIGPETRVFRSEMLVYPPILNCVGYWGTRLEKCG